MNTLALVGYECQLVSNQRFGAPSLLLHYSWQLFLSASPPSSL